jgi:4-amino-4-deoxy-L-arabinose transferase-like glycosyltransferase
LGIRNNHPLLLFLLTAVLYFTGLGARDFWAPVEPRYAEIARVMFAKSQWIVPTINGDLYTDKPILYFWVALVASKALGSVNEWTVRLPAALGGIVLVLATYAIGSDFLSRRAGFIAAAVLATSARVVWEARWAHIDTLFAGLFVLAMYFAARTVLQRGSPNEILLAYCLMAVASLAKGLIGVVLPALILLTYMIARRDWRLLAEAKLPLGISLYLLIVGPWVYLVNSATGGKWLADFVLIHHIQRYTHGVGHRQPYYYYLTTLPVDFLPWTVFAVAALAAYFPYRKIKQAPATLFLSIWFFVVLIFFTLSDTKRDLYLLPLMPTMALLVGQYIDDMALDRLPHSRLYLWLAGAFFGLVAIGGAALPPSTWVLRREVFAIGLPAALILTLGGVFAVHFIFRRNAMKTFFVVTAMMALLVIAVSGYIFPYLETYKSPRSFSQTIKRVVPTQTPLYIFADSMNDFNYYTGRTVIPVLTSSLEVKHLYGESSGGYLIIKNHDLKKLETLVAKKVVAVQAVGSTVWNLIDLNGSPSR